MKSRIILLLVIFVAINSVFTASAMEADKSELNAQLFNAIIHNKCNDIEALIGQGASLDVLDNKGYTPLGLAAHCATLDEVKKLVELGAPVNQRDHSGMTALMWACVWHKDSVIEYLIQNGADVHLVEKCGVSALQIAANNNQGLTSCDLLVGAMFRLHEKQRKEREAVLCFLFCCKKAKDSHIQTILKCLPRDLVQLIARESWVKFSKTREEIKNEIDALRCLTDTVYCQRLKQNLLAKYYPDEHAQRGGWCAIL